MLFHLGEKDAKTVTWGFNSQNAFSCTKKIYVKLMGCSLVLYRVEEGYPAQTARS